MMQEEARSVWEGRIADTALRVEVQPSGRIVALWRAKGAAAKIRRAWRVPESRTCSSLAADR